MSSEVTLPVYLGESRVYPKGHLPTPEWSLLTSLEFFLKGLWHLSLESFHTRCVGLSNLRVKRIPAACRTQQGWWIPTPASNLEFTVLLGLPYTRGVKLIKS